MLLRAAHLVAACVVCSTACGSGDVDTVVIDAVVDVRCVDGGDCTVEPERAAVPVCGQDIVYADDDEPVRVYSDVPAAEIAAVVAVRHEQGEAPARSALDGSTTRGAVVVYGDHADVVGLLRPDGLPLYRVDDLGQIVELDRAALRSEVDDVFTFAYRVGDLDVQEVHTLRARERRPLDLIGPEHLLGGCCASVDGTTSTLWLTAGAVLVRRRRRR